MSLLLKGLIVGFCLSAPVGPIAALCVQRTISKRLVSGLVSGLGAAAADAVYGAVAAFGATMISEFLISERTWMQRVGGVILIFMGLRLFLTKPAKEEAAVDGKGLTGDFLSTFFLTLTNPMTFVAFAAVFTTMGIGAVRGHPILTTELVGGVFLGSAIWWLILCGGAHALRKHCDYRKLTVINRGTGVFVIGVGLVYLLLSSRPSSTPPNSSRLLPTPSNYPSNPMLACVPSQNGLFPDPPQRHSA
jgi:threonine/homoserine/homoserine lactone efflux protein